VLPNTDAAPASSSLRLDIRRFPWINRLAADYAHAPGRLAPFFAGDVRDTQAWRDAVSRAQAHPRQREVVASVLAAQQERRAAPQAAREAAARLRDASTVVVATGQQAGLFGGPLFTLLKALSAIRLAETVAASQGVPTVAVFWVDGEDHDWAEVNACGVLNRDEALHEVSLAEAPPAGCSVASVQLGPSVEQAIAGLEAALPPTDFTAGVLADLRRAYVPGLGMADAFARYLETLLGPRGLVVYDASDVATKPLVAQIFAREIQSAGDTVRHATEAGAALAALGYHAQVTPAPGSAALFRTSSGRASVKRANDGLLVGDVPVTVDALVARALAHPDEFSPNVLLRPIVQDTLFPTVCYVAGPAELAYFAQLKAVYDAFGVPMPLVVPRASATLLDSNATRFVGRAEVAFEALRVQDESALNALLAAALPPSVDGAVSAVLEALERTMTALAGEAAGVDATLDGATRSAMGRMQDDVRKLQGKILQAAKRKDETLRRQFTHAQALAFPGGTPQERAVGVVSFLNKYGPALIARLETDVTLELGVHVVLTP
jgi:bacillithiol biosynthesis cysteine-adding enzyme BshC